MACKNCLIEDLKFEIRFEQFDMLELTKAHLERRGFAIMQENHILGMTENAARELVDFSKDFSLNTQIEFRLEGEEWQPLVKLETILEGQWVDEIIKRNAIICYSQPIVDAEENIYGYEILSRFKNTDGSLLYPNEVFAAAKKRGRLYALDRSCRLEAVRYSVQLTKKSFINFIPTSIYSPEFCLQSTIRLANKLNIDPNRFVFEVVESEQIEDVDHLRTILQFYNERGFQYALDDVGEGYSTLEMLTDLEPHYMKLDMKYAQGVSKDVNKQKAAITFLQRAIEVGATPLAEGVEFEEDFEWLKAQGYELFQGYLFGKPTAEPLVKLLA